jgi:hypothetical protein
MIRPLLSPPDDSMREAAIDAEADRIADDAGRLFEAVLDGGNDGDDVSLAELRIVMRNASPALRRLFHGDLFGDVTLIKSNMDALRSLVIAADAADTLVAERIQQAAEDALS